MLNAFLDQKPDLKDLAMINDLPVHKQILLLEKNADVLDKLIRQFDELDDETLGKLEKDTDLVEYTQNVAEILKDMETKLDKGASVGLCKAEVDGPDI